MTTTQPPATALPTPLMEELERLRRLEALEEILPTIAGVLDLREVFEKIAEIAKRVLDFDAVAVMALSEDRQTARVYAITGGVVARTQLPPELPVPPDVAAEDWDVVKMDDIRLDRMLAEHPGYKVAVEMGLRSILRAAIRVEGKIVAAINFASKRVGAFHREDMAIARRVAARIALAFSHERLAQAVRRATVLEERVKTLADELDASYGRHKPVGASAPWRAVLTSAGKVAPTETTVLLTGESGTGKEVLARTIHAASARAKGPFVPINCAALPEALLESELFGHEKGAFSGAAATKPGRIEQAAGGTLFLDELGELPLPVQAKLLRFLQEREFQRLGGTKMLKADVRLVTATNRDLPAQIQKNAFREDLYYRVSVFEIKIPPLRERPDDIVPLATAFLTDVARSLGRAPASLAPEARDRLIAHRWPGNARELRNVLERASILCEGGRIMAADLGFTVPGPVPAALEAMATASDLRSVEKAAIQKVLEECKFNKSTAAKKLGLTRGQLYLRLKRYGLE